MEILSQPQKQMNAKERKEAFDNMEEPKPSWERFKRMLWLLDGDVEQVKRKWRNRIKK